MQRIVEREDGSAGTEQKEEIAPLLGITRTDRVENAVSKRWAQKKNSKLRTFVVGALFGAAVVLFATYFVVSLDRMSNVRKKDIRHKDRNKGGFVVLPPTLATFCPPGTNTLSNIPAALRRADPSQLVIDVGAFDGSDSIAFALAGHRVLAFEPSPSKIERIRQNLVRSGVADRVVLYDFALADESGVRPFHVNRAIDPEEIRFMGSAPGSAQDAFAVPWEGSDTVNVRVERLDDVLDREFPGEDPPNIFLLKIDAQGFDFDVLRGAERLLAEQRVRVIQAEFAVGLMPPSDDTRNGGRSKVQTAIELLTFLHKHGYQCAMCGGGTIDGRGAPLVPVDAVDFADAISEMRFMYRGVNHGAWDNLVCVPGFNGRGVRRLT